MRNSKNEYRELFKNFPEFEWCKLIKTSKFSKNLLAKCTVIFIKKIAPELARPCPIQSIQIEKSNITIPNIIIQMVSSGEYRVTSIMKYKNGDVFFNSSVIVRAY